MQWEVSQETSVKKKIKQKLVCFSKDTFVHNALGQDIETNINTHKDIGLVKTFQDI